LLSAVRDFRAGAGEFFVAGKPGPKTAPGKDAARPRILELRAAGHSIDEIAAALAAEGTPLNRTGIAEVIAAEGRRGCGAARRRSGAGRCRRSRPALSPWTSAGCRSGPRRRWPGCCW
jgi:hypothetical protein